MALNPNVVVVAPGELITSAHINNIRANLDRIDILAVGKVAKAGDTMTGPLIVAPGAVNSARFDAAQALFGKAAANVNASGVEIDVAGGATNGRITSTVTTWPTPNTYLNHGGTSDAHGSAFANLTRATTVIGAITQVNTTGVAYGTTSDKRLKTLTRPVDPDEAVAKVAALEPVQFTWTDHPEEGEQIGFFAQDLYPVAPEAVTVGVGEPGDAPDPETGEGGFVPWMIDPTKLVPVLVAAVAALTRRIEQLEETSP